MKYDIDKVADDYFKAFGQPLPVDFAARLQDPRSEKEYVETIQRAIRENKPFEDEGIV